LIFDVGIQPLTREAVNGMEGRNVLDAVLGKLAERGGLPEPQAAGG
jgi:hypothetical protein